VPYGPRTDYRETVINALTRSYGRGSFQGGIRKNCQPLLPHLGGELFLMVDVTQVKPVLLAVDYDGDVVLLTTMWSIA
jgi:hypothetical protein